MEEQKLTAVEYCEKFEEWARIMREAYYELQEKEKNGEEVWYPQGKDFIEHLNAVELAIKKSSLLARMVYGNQKPRTKKCPMHKGRWSGLYHERPSYDNEYCGFDKTPCECYDGWEVSGWIPE